MTSNNVGTIFTGKPLKDDYLKCQGIYFFSTATNIFYKWCNLTVQQPLNSCVWLYVSNFVPRIFKHGQNFKAREFSNLVDLITSPPNVLYFDVF